MILKLKYLAGYNGICKQGHYNNRFHGGVAIYTHSSCPIEPLAIQSNLQVIATRIQLQHSNFITIASLYIPGRQLITQQDLKNLITQHLNSILDFGRPERTQSALGKHSHVCKRQDGRENPTVT